MEAKSLGFLQLLKTVPQNPQFAYIFTNMRDKIWRNVTAFRRHQKQCNVTII